MAIVKDYYHGVAVNAGFEEDAFDVSLERLKLAVAGNGDRDQVRIGCVGNKAEKRPAISKCIDGSTDEFTERERRHRVCYFFPVLASWLIGWLHIVSLPSPGSREPTEHKVLPRTNQGPLDSSDISKMATREEEFQVAVVSDVGLLWSNCR